MPNIVVNRVTLEGDPEKIARLLSDVAYDADPENEMGTGAGSFDFRKVIPMPESLNIECGSTTNQSMEFYLQAVHPDTPAQGVPKFTPEQFSSLISRLNGERFYGTFRTSFSEKERTEMRKGENAEKMLSLGRTAVDNYLRYGSVTWYDWSIRNWGTKWNAFDAEKGHGDGLYFSTAWSAPHPVLEALAEKYPDVRMIHEWADEDIGQNCGKRTYENGRCVEEYFPGSDRESVEFACDVWEESPEDFGLILNASETFYLSPSAEKYEPVELFGERALFSNERLKASDIPKGLYVYQVRGDDDTTGGFAELSPQVLVNHFGSIVTRHPIDFGKDGFLLFTPENEPKFLGEKAMSLEDFLLEGESPEINQDPSNGLSMN